MRSKMYTLVILITIFSCKSVEKMVERGEYDEAFSYSISKLQGEKNKKTSYVQALEKAFVKLNNASFKEIQQLDVVNRPENLSKAIRLYQVLEARQNRLDPLLPLISKDGYVASFDMVDYTNLVIKAEEGACQYFYDNGRRLLNEAKSIGNKAMAKKAFTSFNMAQSYRSHYKDTDKLKSEAIAVGLTKINFEVKNEMRDFYSRDIEREIWNLPVSNLDNIWYDYSIGNPEKAKEADFTVVVVLEDIDFSPERERINNYIETKDVVIRKEKVKQKRDTTVVWLEKEIFQNVRADISEIIREKKSKLLGTVKVFDHINNEYIKSIPINVYNDFQGYACNFIGDERALTQESRNKLDSCIETFPPDYVMADDLAAAFASSVMAQAKRLSF